MRKIIAIGESVVDIVFKHSKAEKTMVGGRIACSAASLGAIRLPVAMTSECATDSVGDIVIDFLTKHHVDVRSIDRFTDGTTALSAIFLQDDGTGTIVNYGKYPADRFSVVWPRIDENDVVIFGSLYAIDTPQRERLFELLSYCVERKAILVYLPGFQHGIGFRITRVMPAILENFEISNVVIAHERDMNDIFPGEQPQASYHNHIEFFCSTFFLINQDLSVSFFAGKKRKDFACITPSTTNLLGWQAGFTAGIVFELLRQGLGRIELSSLSDDALELIVKSGYEFAAQSAASLSNCVPADFAALKKTAFDVAEAQRKTL